MSNEIVYDTAGINDISELVRLRIAYMIDDFGSISDKERQCMEEQLPGYFERKLGNELIAFVARAEERLVAAAYLLIIEKPANPFLLNGLDSEVLSVYTEPGYRKKGICSQLMNNMIDMQTYFIKHYLSTYLTGIMVSLFYLLTQFFRHQFSLVLGMIFLSCGGIIDGFQFR